MTLQDIEDNSKAGLHYLTSGGGSAAQEEGRGLCCNDKVRFFAAQPGFAAVAVSPDRARFQFWGQSAQLLHEFTLSK